MGSKGRGKLQRKKKKSRRCLRGREKDRPPLIPSSTGERESLYSPRPRQGKRNKEKKIPKGRRELREPSPLFRIEGERREASLRYARGRIDCEKKIPSFPFFKEGGEKEAKDLFTVRGKRRFPRGGKERKL